MQTDSGQSRIGITCSGNWIVDRVKLLDRLPDRGMLGTILSEALGTGGAPFNVLAGLSRLGALFPLAGAGVVGVDADGDYIMKRCGELRLDVSRMVRTDQAVTSYTDVMTEQGSGVRSFYHYRGANALFGPEHIAVENLTCRMFHLGYLLLLDKLDADDPEHGTVAARLLRTVQAAGIKTSVDVVSEDSDRFARLVPAALKYTDYLIFNEIEAGRTTGIPVRNEAGQLDGSALLDSVEALFDLGNMELAVVHMPEGAYARTRAGARYVLGSLSLPPGFIAGTVGAGDAFCAGVLYSLHEGWNLDQALHLGRCTAAACLAHPSATDGIMRLDDVLALGERFPEMAPPLQV